MSNRGSRRVVAVLSALGLAWVAWATPSEAQDDPAPSPSGAAPAPPPPAPKTRDADRGELAPNSIFVEGLGAAIAYSINYERMVIPDLGVRLGFSYLSIGASENAGGSTSTAGAKYVFFPVTVSYVGVRSGSSALELGAGVTMLYVSASSSSVGVSTSGAGLVPYGVFLLGYRLQPVDHAGFMFRVGINALVAPGLGLDNSNPSKLGAIPWPYISFGASF